MKPQETDRQAAKQEARKARNEAQAIEEKAIWAQINAQADQAVIAMKPKRGAPSTYREELGLEIIERLSNGQSLASICKLDYMPHIATVYEWIRLFPQFGDGYARARENAAHTFFDQCIDIADDCSNDMLKDGTPNSAAIARAKLKIETRQRAAAKLHAKVYGERLEQLAQTVNVTNNSLTIDGRTLDATQRDTLRALLLSAKGD